MHDTLVRAIERREGFDDIRAVRPWLMSILHDRFVDISRKRLADRARDADRSAPPRDPEADRFFQETVARQPGSPYYMAQTIIVQEQALEAARARIRELEAQGSRSSGGGGFLAGVAQTAVGVAGGMMLGSMLGGMLGGEHPLYGAGDALADAGDAVETEVADAGDAMGFDDFGGGEEF